MMNDDQKIGFLAAMIIIAICGFAIMIAICTVKVVDSWLINLLAGACIVLLVLDAARWLLKKLT